MRFTAILSLALLLPVVTRGLQAQVPVTVPVPGQFGTATTVFLINDGGDDAYQSLYRALSVWNKYRLVSTPAEAELAFEVSAQESDYVTNGTSLSSPYVRLRVQDVKTHVLLWSLTEVVGRRHHRDQELDKTSEKFIEDLKALAQGSFPHLPGNTKTSTDGDQKKTRLSQETK
jgi:hypothetical protein